MPIFSDLPRIDMKSTLLLLAFALIPDRGFSQKVDSLQVAQAVDSLITTAEQLWRAGNNEEALPLVQQAADMSKQTWGPLNARYASALHRMASIYFNMADYKKAEALNLETIDIRKKGVGYSTPRLCEKSQ